MIVLWSGSSSQNNLPQCHSSNPSSSMQRQSRHAAPDHELSDILPDPCAVKIKRIETHEHSAQ